MSKTPPAAAYLKQLFDRQIIDPILIIGPPRSNSSLTQWVISRSPDIDGRAIVEPMFQPRDQKKDPNTFWNNILNPLIPQLNDNPQSPITFTIKDLPHRFFENQNALDLLSLTRKPILLLIRHPLLTTASRIKKTLLTASLKYGDSHPIVSKIDLNKVKTAQQTEDYSPLAEILEDKNFFPFPRSGFKELSKLTEILDKNKKTPFIILNTSQLRNDPETIIPQICSQLEIKVELEKMLHWTKKDIESINLNPKLLGHYEQWFVELTESNSIHPEKNQPNKVILPKKIQQYLNHTDLPIFEQLINHPNLLEGTTTSQIETINPRHKI